MSRASLHPVIAHTVRWLLALAPDAALPFSVQIACARGTVRDVLAQAYVECTDDLRLVDFICACGTGNPYRDWQAACARTCDRMPCGACCVAIRARYACPAPATVRARMAAHYRETSPALRAAVPDATVAHG